MEVVIEGDGISVMVSVSLSEEDPIAVIELSGQGPTGATGASAYACAVAEGFSGSEGQWLVSLKGDTGAQGPAGAQGATGAAGVGVPTGGATGQVLAKSSVTDYATAWVDQTGGGSETPDVPAGTFVYLDKPGNSVGVRLNATTGHIEFLQNGHSMAFAFTATTFQILLDGAEAIAGGTE
jgi:hypothetical protein